MTVDSSLSENSSEVLQKLAQSRLLPGLRGVRVKAGVTCCEAANILDMPREVFDDLEAGNISLEDSVIINLLGLWVQLMQLIPDEDKTEV